MATFLAYVGRPAVGRMGWAACLAVCLAARLTWASPAGAQPAAALDWQAPPGCPSGEAFTERIAQLLGRPMTLQEASQGQRVSVVIQERGDLLHLRIDIGSQASPDRELEGPNCSQLVEAAALFVALSLDAEAAAADPASTPLAPPATETPQAPAEVASSPDLPAPTPQGSIPEVPRRPRRRRPRSAPSFYAAAAAVFDSGALPGPSGGVEGALGWTRDRLTLELSALWLAPRTATLDASVVAVQLASAAWRLCGRLTAHPERRFALSGCPVAEAGALLSRPRQGIEGGGGRNRSPWLAAGAGLEGRLRVADGWHMALWGAVLAPLVRARVAALSTDGADLQVLYRPAAWTARIALRVKRTF